MKNRQVKELRSKLEQEKKSEIDKKKEQRQMYAKIREENESLKEKLAHKKVLEREKDKRYIEDYNTMMEIQESKRNQEKEERYNRIKGMILDLK